MSRSKTKDQRCAPLLDGMIEAMGGNLEIKAHFPQGDVKIGF